MIDINGDKRIDVCCVDANGDFQCWLNDSDPDPKSPRPVDIKWKPTGYLKKNTGFTGDQVSRNSLFDFDSVYLHPNRSA